MRAVTKQKVHRYKCTGCENDPVPCYNGCIFETETDKLADIIEPEIQGDWKIVGLIPKPDDYVVIYWETKE